MKLIEEKISDIELIEGWEIQIAETVEQIEGIRPVWERMQKAEESPSIDADIDRYLSVIKALKEDVQPYVITLVKEGIPEVMIVGRIQMHEIKIKLGYKSFLNPKLKSLMVVYGGILGDKNERISSLVIRVLTGQLRKGKFDLVYLNHLKKDSNIFRQARKIPGVASRGYFPKYEKHWLMSVPENTEKFYMSLSKRHRANIKRYKRKLEKEYANKFKTVIYERESDLETAIKDASKISRTTYQKKLGYGFDDNSITRELLETAAAKEWLRIHMLYINGEPCAFQLGLQYGNTYFLVQLAFNPRWKKWNVGTVLFMKNLEELCLDSSIDKLDFGFGDAEYKQSYGNREFQEATVYIFAPKFYPVLINFLYSSFTGINLGWDYILNKTGLKNKIKRLWRNRLIQKADV